MDKFNWEVYVTCLKFWLHEIQTANEQVEYSLVVCVFNDTKRMIMLYMAM